MKMNLTSKEWLQNRLIDLGFLLIISIFVIPIGGFSFIGEAQKVHPVLPWPAIFGFMIPELFFVSVFGVVGLAHHKKVQWSYQNPRKVFFGVILGIFLIFFPISFIIDTFFPSMRDCIISFYWGAKPCSALDVDGFLSIFLYVYFFIPITLIFLMFLIVILSPDVQRPNKITLIALSFSSLLLLSGISYLGFTYLFYPTLVPSYGLTERFHLEEYNNYTTNFQYYANTRLHLKIKANRTISIFIDGNNVHNGSFYELTTEPQDVISIKLNSNSPVSGRIIAWQEPPWWMQIRAFILLLAGLTATLVSLGYWYWSQKNLAMGQRGEINLGQLLP